MDMRDDFAAAAVSGILANPDPNIQVAYMSPDDIADMAYEIADAMLSRRKTTNPTLKARIRELS